MPTPGLSLVGFLTEQEALYHLGKACVPAANADDAALRADWLAAKGKLGAPVPNDVTQARSRSRPQICRISTRSCSSRG